MKREESKRKKKEKGKKKGELQLCDRIATAPRYKKKTKKKTKDENKRRTEGLDSAKQTV